MATRYDIMPVVEHYREHVEAARLDKPREHDLVPGLKRQACAFVADPAQANVQQCLCVSSGTSARLCRAPVRIRIGH